MKTTVNLSDFRDAFRAHDRQDQFTYEGLGLIFNYLDALEDDTGVEYELDVIAICCEFIEQDLTDIIDAYEVMDADEELPTDPDELRAKVRAYLEENTTIVGETATGFVFLQF